MWKAGPLCIFWMVWKARNGVVFRDEVLFVQKHKSFFFLCKSSIVGDQIVHRGWSQDLSSIH